MNRDDLLAHLDAIEAQLSADTLIRYQLGEDNVLHEIRQIVQNWDGDRLAGLFEPARWAKPAYAMARLVTSAPGFVTTPERLNSIEPCGEEFGNIIAGDLHVDGDVDMYHGEAVIVLGDLHATSVSADECSHVIVAGTIHARTVWSEGFVLARDMRAELVYGSYEAGDLGVSDTLTARAVINDRHNFDAGHIQAEFVFDGDSYDMSTEEQSQVARFATLVSPSVITNEDEPAMFGRVDMCALRQHVEAGNDVFAS